MDSEQFLDKLYPGVAKQRRRAARLRRSLRHLRHWGRYLLALMVVVALWAVAHIYYYNKLVDLEFNIQASWAQVEVQWQRRYHIQQNLTRMVVEYARHERSLMTRLTTMRTGHEPAARDKKTAPDKGGEAAPPALAALKAELSKLSPAKLNQLFPQIQVVAEQYPALRLTENFQQFSTAIVETETTIAKHIETYNSAVNVYTTLVKQFPALVFARACGFPDYQFYRPGKDTLKFRPVETKLDS